MTAGSADPDPSPGSAAPAGGEIWGTFLESILGSAVERHGTANWDAVAMEVQSRSPPGALVTPASCRNRYRLLYRRLVGGDGVAGDEDEPDAAAVKKLADELREARMVALRRGIQESDLSIGSLKSKVKRLEDEREESLSGEPKPAVKEVRKGSPEEAAAEDRVSGEVLGRSCEESNSTDLKQPEHAAPVNDEPPAREEAAAGEVAVKEEASGVSVAASKEAAAGEVAVKDESSGESAARSKEADAEKESSDVQSSASLSRRRRQKGGVQEASASASASVPLPAAESEPLLALLESVRTSKPGSVFERRLDSQESERYRGMIRRHVDLGTIRSKLEGGGGAACYATASEFYCDLLLLCANALVYFPRGSPEHAAAVQTRALVSKHISKTGHPGSSGKAAVVSKKKPKPDAAESLLEKAAPIIVCRKRSSITKATAAAAKEVKEDKAETDKKKEAARDVKTRGLRTNKSRGTARTAAANQRTGKASESSDGSKKSDKKGDAAGVAKKRNAVDFLNRINQNGNGSSSTERVSLLETLKLSATEQKKSSSPGKDHPGGSGSKKAAADSSGGRRIGRPPKRAAAPPSPPPSKRAREDKPSRKRGKK